MIGSGNKFVVFYGLAVFIVGFYINVCVCIDDHLT